MTDVVEPLYIKKEILTSSSDTSGVLDGIGQKKLQASGLAKSSWDEMEAAVSALSPSVFVMMLTVVRRSFTATCIVGFPSQCSPVCEWVSV